MADVAQKIEALLLKADGHPAAMLLLARLMRANGRFDEALALSRRAKALAPDDPKLAAEFERFRSEDVPRWHFDIVRDESRNAAYDRALRRAMQSDSSVLEIGTGTGLLAMMAARAGAAQVVTCEMSATIAELATEIVARNGYADRVRVVAKHSDKLDAETDLGGRADILVSEIVSNDLLAKDVLSVHERAVRDLLKPGGRVIPASGRIRVALAEDLHDEKGRLGVIDGFDLSAFNRLAPPVRRFSVGHERLRLRSDAADLLTFNFTQSGFCAPATESIVLRATGGPINGIAQWIALQLDEETVYENRPSLGATSCWSLVFYPLPKPIAAAPGQEIRVGGSHDRRHIAVWVDA